MEISEKEFIQMKSEINRLTRMNEALVAVEVEKVPAVGLFKGVAIHNTYEVETANAEHGHLDLGRYVLPANQYYRLDNRGYIRSDMKDVPMTHELHDMLRSLTLAAFGTKKNIGLQTRQDQDEAVKLYQALRMVWVEAYRERLDRVTE